MKAVTQGFTTLGDLLQAFSLGLLENVASQLGRDAEAPQPNGRASAKLALPSDLGYDYLYVGFDERGFFAAEYKADMTPGRSSVIWGPKAISKTVDLTLGVLAHQIVSKVPKK